VHPFLIRFGLSWETMRSRHELSVISVANCHMPIIRDAL
jgi:hypothetical protein